MKTNLIILIVGLVAIIAVGGIYLYTQKSTTLEEGNELDDFGDENEDPVACAQDALQCPDGSYVSRTGPNCEFTECPSGDCVLEGGELLRQGSQSCCPELSQVFRGDGVDENCNTIDPDPFDVCIMCGNGVCGLGENKCNCPEDCQE